MIIDVSVYQGVINWPAIKADHIELAIIKATEGIGFTDPRFAQNWAGAKAAGVPRGAYHFAHPDGSNNAISEASYFLGVVEAHGLDPIDTLAEDYEVLGGGAAWSLSFLGHLQGVVANLLAFYSNYSGCSRVNDPRMARYPLWLAYPGDGVHVPPCPKPWTHISLWQYRVGTLPGIVGGVDEDANVGLLSGAATHLISGGIHDVIFLHDTDNNDIFVVYEDPILFRTVKRHISLAEWTLYAAGGATYRDITSGPLQAVPDGSAPALGGSTVTVDQSAVLAAIADLKAHPSFDPNDAATLAIVSKLEAAARAAGNAA